MTPPRVLTEIGLDDARARACVRFSFDWRNRAEECAHVGALVGAVIGRLRKKN
jgi:cysteine sulfinate desulfinase/cysteine desulfurase-like protein